MLSYAVFDYNDFTGSIMGVDWRAVDVLLRRADINPSPQAFEDFRVILNAFIATENEQNQKR